MPALKNARHERFAQEMAKGKSQTEAYSLAGYDGDRTAASRLSTNVNVRTRLAELQDRGAERAVVTTESLIEEADEIKALALKASQYGPANAALTLKAKLAGKLVERAEVGTPGDFDRMDDADLARYVATEAAALGLGPAGVAASHRQARVRGELKRVH